MTTAKGFAKMILVDLLLPLAVVLNIYLYFYPLLYSCAFPRPAAGDTPAPFRLLTLADPQIEGDTTLRRYIRQRRDEEATASVIARLQWEVAGASLALRKYGKMLDLWGNDLYLSHVYRTMKRHTFPTHVTVLGDLLGSQWISDAEFLRRAARFWRIFRGSSMVDVGAVDAGLGDWKDTLIMTPGNHDVGYAGDISRPKLLRYERAFGPYNYVLTFRPNGTVEGVATPELRVAVLNSLTLDSPIWDQSLADESYSFLAELEKGRREGTSQATLLLTHLPLHKPARICADGPEVTYFPPHHGGGIRSQNFVSEDVSNRLKEMVFGPPRESSGGIIMTGHDHEGCQSVHFWDEEEGSWKAEKWAEDGWRKNAVREITVRSMMGEYGGNAGLLSAWFDAEKNEWRFEYVSCALGIQHVWWTVHVVNVIAAVWATLLALWYVTDFLIPTPKKKAAVPAEKKAQ